MNRRVYLTIDDFRRQKEELDVSLPFSDSVSVLSSPFTVGNKTFHNRLVCQAMEGCDGNADGSPGELTQRRYRRFAKGGAGTLWFEATAVIQEGRANPRQLFLHKENLDDFKRATERIKETGIKENGYAPRLIMQATHSGRYSKPNGIPAPMIAYHNPIFEKETPISSDRIVSDEYIDTVKERLINAAALAEKAGFDGVDIKACHRYLNSELLSAYERKGRYGGSLENRTRLLRESILGAMQVCKKDFIVTSRLNVYDGFAYPNGFGVKTDGSTDFDETEPVWLIKQLRGYGVKLLNITMGNPYFNPHINRPYAVGGYVPEEHPLTGVARILNGIAKLKKAVPEIAYISSGITFLGVAAPHVTAGFIERGAFDFAGFGRTAFAYPDFANDILKNGEMKKEKICICCSKCTQIMRAGGTPGCVIRDKETYAPVFEKYCTRK
ncbi:MAG: hypothetical protein SPH68_01205 [Candidatus Borkfalkiaceae bacterium]|nr:flavin oxidoreductase/NADH oxidase [Clostridia bacterium]MDY6222762.1 hypothetical protein [Christensenellaceae bacterium]